ncbi:DEAD/DEAH box helicase family protein [Arthrobacter sp. AB6]|uniref:DEAD/DEAH box helicase n=1 Tax=Arthrobacter sp. AB6 TaxID=2962570 RepID=UPI002880D7DC|nr:DEAD/DEAH box helicase family protein [Arthrobacter sp. AB6]MDT0196786.1 DEAD/DEAH box helicase family protein [Arthrobacter sp. AB6]
MRFTLKDYQEAAFRDVVKALRKATRDHSEDPDEQYAVTLSAPTGAGKTVIASAVIEALFNGSDLVAEDPEATVLWVTDDPALNEQTKQKMLSASDLGPAQLVTIDSSFDQQTFDPGKVYFLNIQKLARSNPLTRSNINGRTTSLWDTIAGTIAGRGSRFYVVIDEAHRGMRAEGDRETIVSRILNGQNGTRPAPIVWGISATPHRFDAAMAQRNSKKVSVAIADVRSSGLLKDLILLDNPAASQPTGDTTLVRAAVGKTLDFAAAWEQHATSESDTAVLPVLVVQIGNSPTDAELEELLDSVFGSWPGLLEQNVVNTFGERSSLSIGSRTIRYMLPQDIQDNTEVRVVLCKDAISTGWDCPRAEVLVSFRRAQDHTYITQLIGRMVRTPLARRIAANKVLNTVNIFLPYFNRDQVQSIVDSFASGQNDEPPVPMISNPVYLQRNSEVPAVVAEILASIPTYIVPGKIYRTQVSRLFRLAALLVGDHVVEDAINHVRLHLVGTLEAHRLRLEADGTFERSLRQIRSLRVERSVALLAAESIADLTLFEGTYEMNLDSNNVEDLFRVAKRKLPEGIALAYWNRLVDSQGDDWDPLAAKAEVAALALHPEVIAGVESAAESLVREWLREHHGSISRLPDRLRAQYEPIRREARDSELSILVPPNNDVVQETTHNWRKHLLSDSRGAYPKEFRGWEAAVLNLELADQDLVGWYRNPTGTDAALRVPYPGPHHDRPMYPDFIFFHSTDGGIRPSIVDPHGYNYQDAAAKLKGLARYAEAHGELFARIESVIEDQEGRLVALDLKSPTVREAVEANYGENVLSTYEEHGGYLS